MNNIRNDYFHSFCDKVKLFVKFIISLGGKPTLRCNLYRFIATIRAHTDYCRKRTM